MAFDDGGARGEVRRFVDDADFVYAVCREHDVPIEEPISSKPWGMREFSIRDPNGHLLRIGHSTRR